MTCFAGTREKKGRNADRRDHPGGEHGSGPSASAGISGPTAQDASWPPKVTFWTP